MKKHLFLILLLIGFSCAAHFPIDVTTNGGSTGAIKAEWSPVQIGIFPNESGQLFYDKTEIYGISIGLLALWQKSSVFSFSMINGLTKNYFLQAGGLIAGTGKNYGLSVSPLVNMSGRNYGVQLGLINLESNFGSRSKEEQKGVPGLQIGLINSSGGWQIGLLNHNPHSFLVWLPLINFPVK